MLNRFFKIIISRIPCFRNVSEDELRELVAALQVEPNEDLLGNIVTSTGNIPVKFEFAPDGNFAGVTATIDNKAVRLFGGAGGNDVALFRGAPSETNPGVGWEVEVDLTTKFLNQSQTQADWELFIASRKSVLNTF